MKRLEKSFVQNEKGMESCDTVVILTAGIGKRMKSKITKVLHPLMGKPMLEYLIDVTSFFKNRVFVVQEGCKEVCDLIGNRGKVAFQKEVKGTGDALFCAKNLILSSNFLVIPGDVPLLLKNTIKRLISLHFKEKQDATILALKKKNPTGYGRIIKSQESGVRSQESGVRSQESKVIRIVEERDASKEEKKIGLVNSGIYCFNKEIFALLERVDNKNKQGEYYLTDVFKMLKNASLLETNDEIEVMGINTREDLQIAEDFKRKEILRYFMERGVYIKDLESIYIEEGVKIGRDTIIFPHTFILGKTIVGEDCIIGPSSWIKDTKIEDKARVYFSYVENSIIEKECNIGPFSHIRPESMIKEKASIGAFVQVKKSVIGKETKAGHLAYIGDSLLGERVNVGAGVITCNFDGKTKHRTTIGDDVFIGSNTSLIAPLKIGKKAFIGAGSVITKDVDDEALALERTEQKMIAKWRRKK